MEVSAILLIFMLSGCGKMGGRGLPYLASDELPVIDGLDGAENDRPVFSMLLNGERGGELLDVSRIPGCPWCRRCMRSICSRMRSSDHRADMARDRARDFGIGRDVPPGC